MDKLFLEQKAKEDLDYIIQAFNSWDYRFNDWFTEKLNIWLKNEVEFTDIYNHIKNTHMKDKYKDTPLSEVKKIHFTKAVINIKEITNITVKESKSIFSFITKAAPKYEIIINVTWDYYYNVNWKESWLSWIVDEKFEIIKNKELYFNLVYKNIHDSLKLCIYNDINLMDIWS